MHRQTVTRKYADELHRTINSRDRQIERLQRDIQHQNDRLDESKRREDALQIDRDALAATVEKMGKEIGQANGREITARLVAGEALNAISTLAYAVRTGNTEKIVTTAFALEREGREQLKKASNGAHA